ncbi:hypothetical protein M7I_5524 [Glarea lozoyensis 74030]|nr:hypothetical protein M7I_5524 [Glarea lozoyensis 74030]
MGASIEKEDFIAKILGTEIDGPFDAKPLQDLCARTSWQEGLVMSCEATRGGGMGNIRNVFVDCVRFVIEAGATGFVMPDILLRSNTDLSNLHSGPKVRFDYMFDSAYFKETLQAACPRLKVLDNPPTFRDPHKCNPQDPMNDGWEVSPELITLLAAPEKWRSQFDRWMANETFDLDSTQTKHVDIGSNILLWPMHHDGVPFMNTFGRIFRFPLSVRRLAATILYNLHTTHLPNFLPVNGIQSNAYHGAHLRTSKDAVEAGWTPYEEQSAGYIAQARAANLNVIYVASGSVEDTERFRADAAVHNITTVNKHDLLSESELLELKALTWDQQGLIDYEVLLRATEFGGIDTSSFAWNIALRRHILSKRDDYLSGPEEQFNLKDEYSQVFGRRNRVTFFPRGLWP